MTGFGKSVKYHFLCQACFSSSTCFRDRALHDLRHLLLLTRRRRAVNHVMGSHRVPPRAARPGGNREKLQNVAPLPQAATSLRAARRRPSRRAIAPMNVQRGTSHACMGFTHGVHERAEERAARAPQRHRLDTGLVLVGRRMVRPGGHMKNRHRPRVGFCLAISSWRIFLER